MVRLLALAVLLLTGCTHTRSVSSFESDDAAEARAEINARAERSTATVTLASGERLQADGLRITSDEATWMDDDGVRRVSAPDLVSVRFDRRGRGVLEGVGLGFVTGAAAGVLVGLLAEASDGDDGFVDFSAGENMLIGVILLAPPSALVGAAVGGVRQSRTVYRPLPLHLQPPAEQSRAADIGASSAVRVALGDPGDGPMPNTGGGA